jgi:hypothetical protein
VELLDYLKHNRHALNLAEISRLAGYSNGYLKNVVAGRRLFNRSAQRRVKAVLKDMGIHFEEVI